MTRRRSTRRRPRPRFAPCCAESVGRYIGRRLGSATPDDEDGDGLIEYECPHCGTVIFFDENAFDMEEEHLCPNCHRKVFEDDGEDGDDEE